MKKKTALFITTISLYLIFSLTSCSFLAKILREDANRIAQQSTKTKEINREDHVASLVAESATQTQASLVETPAPIEPAADTPVPSPTIESIVQPTVTPLPTQESLALPTPKLDKEVRWMGLSFTLPGDLDYTVTVEEVEEWPDPNTLEFGKIGAGHILFHLNPSYDYQHFHDGPRIYVFPGESYWKYYEDLTTLMGLNLLIDTGDFSDYAVNEELPFPRFFNAAQIYHSNEKVIRFQNGSGIRYLTAYRQACAPIVTHDLFYAFMGLTEDQSYFVVAIIPIYQSPLQWTTALPPIGDPFYDNYSQHLADVAYLLNGTNSADLYPNLDLLEKLFESLRLSVQ